VNYYIEDVSVCPTCGKESLEFNIGLSSFGSMIKCGKCEDEWLPFELASIFVAKKGSNYEQCRCPFCGINYNTLTETNLEHSFVVYYKEGNHGDFAGFCFDCGHSENDLELCKTCENPFSAFNNSDECAICGGYNPYDEEDEDEKNSKETEMPRKEMESLVRKIEILIDGKKFTKEQALHEAKNHFGVGEGVKLLAAELVGNRLECKDEYLYQSDKKAYIQNAIMRGVYDILVIGSGLLKHMEENPAFFDALVTLLDTKPKSAIGLAEHSIGADIDAVSELVDEVENKLQELVENTGLEGSFDFEDGKSLLFEYVDE